MPTHPWHDCHVDDTLVERAFPVVIEIPKGSKNKALEHKQVVVEESCPSCSCSMRL